MLTLRRTATASALASRALAPWSTAADAADNLLVVGTGALAPVLASAHLWASGGSVRRVLIAGRRDRDDTRVAAVLEAARREIGRVLANQLATAGKTPAAAENNAVEICAGDPAADFGSGTPHTVVQIAYTRQGSPLFGAWVGGRADCISCATLSTDPIVRWADLESNESVHVDLVGAYRRDMRETDGRVIANARVFVDTRAGTGKEGGDLLAAEAEGTGFVVARDVAGELSQLADWRRQPGDRVTVFKSVGHAIEDVAAAGLAFARFQAAAAAAVAAAQ
jgi:alanine dehydrogenase